GRRHPSRPPSRNHTDEASQQVRSLPEENSGCSPLPRDNHGFSYKTSRQGRNNGRRMEILRQKTSYVSILSESYVVLLTCSSSVGIFVVGIITSFPQKLLKTACENSVLRPANAVITASLHFAQFMCWNSESKSTNPSIYT